MSKKSPFFFATAGLDDVSPELSKKDNLGTIKKKNVGRKKRFDRRIMDTKIRGSPKSPLALSKDWYK